MTAILKEHTMKIFYILLLTLPWTTHAQTLYKCTTQENVTVYSETPCNSKPSKKLTIKENTIDQTELRKSNLYSNALPKSVDNTAASSITIINQTDQAMSSRPTLSSQATGSSITEGGGGGAAAITTQPWQ